MKRVFQCILTVFVGVSFLLLSGCPKKITPAKKSSRVIQRPPSVPRPKPPAPKVPVDDGFGKGALDSLKEEEIPPIAKLDPFAEPPANNDKKALEEKTSALKDIFFELDQWSLRAGDMPIVEQNASWMIAHSAKTVKIEGHGDSRGTNEYNLVLGEKRAETVKNAMVKMGVDPARLTVISYGEERPFCQREEEVCYQENRRAHFYVE